MTATISHILFLSLVCISLTNSQKEIPPPEIKGSFQAIGEIVGTVTDYKRGSQEVVQMAFEENYDKERQLSGLEVFELHTDTKFWEDLLTKEAFRYVDGKCKRYLPSDWKSAHMPPSINILEVRDDTIVFPLRQLFALNNTDIISYNKETKYRGIDARFWSYTFSFMYHVGDILNNVTMKVDEYWTDIKWMTSSPNPQVPLAFVITKVRQHGGTVVQDEQYITITHFVEGSPHDSKLQPPKGVYCEGRKKSRNTFSRYKNMKYFSYSYEVVIPEYQSVRTGKTWFNVPERLMRADYTPLSEDSKYISRIFSLNSGSVYEIGRAGNTECNLINLFDIDYDPQVIFNTVISESWKIDGFFGLGAQYYYLGETTKRGIPCSRWQGERKDWPDSGVTSIWEWCIINSTVSTVDLRNETVPVIALNIIVTEAPQDKSSIIYKGLVLDYSFYNFRNYSTPAINAVAFDITPCYQAENMTHVKFEVNVSAELKSKVGSFQSDVTFLESWKSAIYNTLGGKMLPSSLRLQRFKAEVDKYGKLWILFTILDSIENDKDLLDKNAIKTKIEGVVNGKTLTIKWTSPMDSKVYTFSTVMNTFKSQ